MLLLQRLAFLLYLLQFGSAMMIHRSHAVSRPSTFNSPVVPAVRSIESRRTVVVPSAGIGENIADIALKVGLISGTVKCAHELAKQCINAYYKHFVYPKPDPSLIWYPPKIKFPINFTGSEDWEFVGFHGTIKQHLDIDKNTFFLGKPTPESEIRDMGVGFYVSDDILVARKWANYSRDKCLEENRGTSDVEAEDIESMSSASSDCEYAMCAAFISKRYWEKAHKVILSPKTLENREEEGLTAETMLEHYLFTTPFVGVSERVAVAISYVDRTNNKMQMKFMPQHARYMHIVCGPDDGNLDNKLANVADELKRPFAALFEPAYYSRMIQFNIGWNLRKAISRGEKKGTWVPGVAGKKPWTDFGQDERQ